MAGGKATSNASRQRKRVEAESDSAPSSSLKRARDGSAFTKWYSFFSISLSTVCVVIS